MVGATCAILFSVAKGECLIVSFYVYAPFGTTTLGGGSYWDTACASLSAYCTGGCHPTVYCSYPYDISAGAVGGQWIDFWADPSCLSVVITLTGTNACSPSEPAPWGNVVTVECYSGTLGSGSLLGTMVFAHVDSPSVGTYDTGWDAAHVLRGVTEWAKVAGNCPNDCGGCFQGPHIHVEACGASGYNSAIGCSGVTEDSTWMYYW